MAPDPIRILVVEPDEATRSQITGHLSGAGFEVESAAAGTEALAIAERARLSAIVAELVVAGVSGPQLVRSLRVTALNPDVPILVLSHQGDEIDRVVAFEVGVDDYMVKPFSLRELLLRLRTLLRRTPRPADDALRVGSIVVDAERHRAEVEGREIRLTATEFRILAAIAKRAGGVVSRAALLREVWGSPEDEEGRMLDTHVKRIREKLGQSRHCVQTVRGVGYRLVAPDR